MIFDDLGRESASGFLNPIDGFAVCVGVSWFPGAGVEALPRAGVALGFLVAEVVAAAAFAGVGVFFAAGVDLSAFGTGFTFRLRGATL